MMKVQNAHRQRSTWFILGAVFCAGFWFRLLCIIEAGDIGGSKFAL